MAERPEFRDIETLKKDLLAVKEKRLSDSVANYYRKVDISEGVEDGKRYKYIVEDDWEKIVAARDELIQLYYAANTPELQKKAADALGFMTEAEAEENLESRVDNIFHILEGSQRYYSPCAREYERQLAYSPPSQPYRPSIGREYLRWHLDKKTWRLYYYDPEATQLAIDDQDVGHRVQTTRIKVPPKDITPLFFKGNMKRVIREAWLLTKEEIPDPLKISPSDLTSVAKRLVPFHELLDRFSALKQPPN